MAEKKYVHSVYSTQGSLARANALPLRPERQREDRRVRELKKWKKQRVQAELSSMREFSRIQLFLFVAAIVLTVMAGSMFFHASASEIYHARNIQKYEKELYTLRKENDVKTLMTEKSVDLNRVYEIATAQLGMRYPKVGQVIRFSHVESEYVRQNERIPGEKR